MVIKVRVKKLRQWIFFLLKMTSIKYALKPEMCLIIQIIFHHFQAASKGFTSLKFCLTYCAWDSCYPRLIESHLT